LPFVRACLLATNTIDGCFSNFSERLNDLDAREIIKRGQSKRCSTALIG
jgi:hypothetical protein